MKIRFLGTRGEIEASSPRHSKHSGILIDNKILLDCGEKEFLDYNPIAIFVSHLHPDHLCKECSTTIPLYSVEKPEVEVPNWNRLKLLQPVNINGYKITPIPTIHSKLVKSCGFLVETPDKKRVLYTSDLVWIKKEHWDKLRDLDLVITDGSFIREGGMIRRDKETGDIFGHQGIPDLVKLFRDRLGAKQIIFTHFGEWFYKDTKQAVQKLKELGVDYAYDGKEIELSSLQLPKEAVEPITPKVFASPQAGLYLVPPHAFLIWKGDKTLVVKTVKFTEHIGEPLYLIQDSLCFGVVKLGEPTEITEKEFWNRQKEHRITKEEFEDWAWKGKTLYAYPVEVLDTYYPPKPVSIPRGVQTFVSKDNIQFLEFHLLADTQLEYYHAISHVYSLSCLHLEIVLEMESRGLAHLPRQNTLDREVELIKGWIEDYDPNKPTTDQLKDDWRIVMGWYSSIKQGRILYKHYKGEKQRITLDDCKQLALKIFKELVKRGVKFSKPEEYKEGARELFEWIIKQVGEENVPWKDTETEASESTIALKLVLPPHFHPSDVTISFVQKLSDKELQDLYEWLHELYRTEYKEQVTEDLLNANIFILTEMYKRGLIDETYVDKDQLDKEARFAWQEYPIPVAGKEEEYSASEITEETLRSRGYITLQDVITGFREAGIIPIKGQPFASYLVGRVVNEGKTPLDHDIDLVLRQRPDPRVIISLKKHLPDWLAKRLHVVFDPSGPLIGYSVPIHGYAFNPLPREWMVKGFGPYRVVPATQELTKAELKLGKYIVGVKPRSGWEKFEFFDTKEAWEKWAVEHIQNGIWVEEKVDGRRHQLHIDKEKDKVWLFTEDTQRNRASLFPELIEEIKSKLKIKKNAIIDGEILVFQYPSNVKIKNARTKREVGELVPREDTAVITAGKTIPEDIRERLVYVIYDIMLLDDEELVNRPYTERREIYTKIVPKDCQYVDIVRGDLATTMQDFFRLVAKYRSVSGSEGVVCKDAKFLYPVKYTGENRSSDMCKIKNLKEIDVLVLGVVQKKTKEGKKLPVYMYECYIEIPKEKVDEWYPKDVKEVDGHYYAYIGRTYGTSVKVKEGSIITVMPIRIRFYQRNRKTRVSLHPDRLVPVIENNSLKLMTLGELWEYCAKYKSWKTPEGEFAYRPGLYTLTKEGIQEIEYVYRHWFEGNLVHLQQKYGETITTPYHSVYSAEGEWKDAIDNPTLVQCECPRIAANTSLDVKLEGYREEDGRLHWISRGIPFTRNNYSWTDKWVLSHYSGKTLKALCRVLGAYLAEGNLHKNQTSYRVRIANADKAWLDKLARDITSISNSRPNYEKQGNTWQLVIWSKPLYDLILALAGKGKGKRIPEFIYTLAEEYQLEFMKAFWEGDGDKTKFLAVSNINPRILAGWNLLLSMLGYKRSFRWNGTPAVTPVHYHTVSAKKRLRLIPYKGYVYDLGVKSSHTFVDAMGNIIVHNTWMFPYFKEPKPEKKSPDTLIVAERLARLGTGPMPSQIKTKLDVDVETLQCRELERDIVIRLPKCPYYLDDTICPLKKRFYFPRDKLELELDLQVNVYKETLLYPMGCPLAYVYRCRYLKPYYYRVKPWVTYSAALSKDFNLNSIIELDEFIDYWRLPRKLHYFELSGKYMEYPDPDSKRRFIMQSHQIGKAQHIDFRMEMNGYLIGWSIVGGNVDDPITPQKLLERMGKGFRAEEKALQPKVWLVRTAVKSPEDLRKDIDTLWHETRIGQSVTVPPGEVGAGKNVEGKFTTLTKGHWTPGAQKVWFHEYFIKDDKYFPTWTRIVIRAVRVPKLDPETKQPMKGVYEVFWRLMIPKDQLPYALSKRAIKEGWKPPKKKKLKKVKVKPTEGGGG